MLFIPSCPILPSPSSPGHLMGKKSLDDLLGVGNSDPDSDYLTALERGDKLLDRFERPSKLMHAFLRALVDRESPRLLPASSEGLDLLANSRRRMEEERRDRYLREVSSSRPNQSVLHTLSILRMR